MAMGTDGMGMMAEMEMPLPDNTLPMMTGFGQFGSIEMGGMFTVMKVREGLGADDYKDPGPYKNPPGTVAYEVNVAEAGEPTRQPGKGEAPGAKMPEMDMPGMDMPGMKSGGHHGHH
jgi:manganese oxidase